MNKLHVEYMKNSRGNTVKNQVIIRGKFLDIFQSYDSVIASVHNDGSVYLDKNFWNYSKTTSTYRNIFLEETTKETKKKIKDRIYHLIDLNK